MLDLRRYLGVFALAATATACDPGGGSDPDDPMQEEAMPAVQLRSARAIASGSGLARVTDLFSVRVPPAVPEASILPWAVGAVKLRLEAVSGECIVVDSDDATYVEVTWADSCQSWIFNVGGSIRGEAQLSDNTDCGEASCPRSAVWTIDADDLRISILGQPVDSTYTGLIAVDAPIDGSAVGWRTGRDFELEFGFGTYGVASQARWDVDDDDCVTLDLDAELELVDSDNTLSPRLEEAIGTVVLSTDGVRRCGNRCPEAGNVFLSYGQGRFLQWSYGQRADLREVEVSTPRGRTFVATLSCQP